MKRWGIWAAALALIAGGFLVKGCGFGENDSKSGGGGPSGHVIPGPGEKGFDQGLEDVMEQWFLQFKLFNSAAVGVGYNEAAVNWGDDAAKEILNRYFNQYPAIKDFVKFCQQDSLCQGKYNALVDNPQDPGSNGILTSFGAFGDTGAFGGVAAVGDLLRYAVLRDQGYPKAMVEEARARAIHCLEFIDIANSISGVPGVMVRGLRRKDHPPAWSSVPFDPNQPRDQKKGEWREDGTADQRYFAEWGWMDDASKDQMDGWIFAMGVAWDVIAEDPTIPEYYRAQMKKHAGNFARRLMEPAPEVGGADMMFRDADGKLTMHCDFHPNVMNFGGCWSAGLSPTPLLPFNAVMGLGAIRVMYHISGDEDIRDYYYQELIGKRRWHEFIRDSALPITDMNYATNYSNVDMVFMAFYNALRYETDPQVLAVLQQGLERLWDNGKNHRQPQDINQSFFDFMYAGLRAGGNVPGEVAGGIDTLKQWPYPPLLWAAPVFNCDDAELLQGWCLAVDGVTRLELPYLHHPDLYQYYLRDGSGNIIKPMGLGHNGTIVAESVVPRRLRSPSNYDWRSDPFEPDQGGRGSNPYEIEATGDIIPAYWLGRFLVGGHGGNRNVSPVGRRPTAPEAATGLVATPLSESQIVLAWTDATNLEDEYIIERKTAAESEFQELARVARNGTAYTDLNLAALTTYLYRVIAVNELGRSAPSNLAPATTFVRPVAPPLSGSTLVATALDDSRIELTWKDHSANEQGFQIIREDLGALAVTTANVTSFTDTGLQDNTTYRYLIVAYNSAGEAWPSNLAEATTDKLPSIFAVSPLKDEPDVSIYIGEIKVGFGDPVLVGEVLVTVADEVGPIDGTGSLDGTGTTLTFIPDPLILTMSTKYTVTVTVDPVVYEYSFYTAGPSWTMDLAAGVGKAFAMDIFNAEFVEPVALRDLLSGLDLKAFLLLGILDADTALQQMRILGALGDIDGPDPLAQDTTQPSLLMPQPADLTQNPAWELGPFDFPIMIEGIEVTIEEARLSGVFEKDYHYTGKGEFEGDLDLGLLAGLVGLDPAEVCAIAGGCLACPGEPGRIECVHLFIRNMRADVKADPLVPIAAVSGKDLGGLPNQHTIELLLKHPATGAPEAGVQLAVTVFSGNGTLNSGLVTTAADGKATVVLTDTDAGNDELKIDIQSPVLYKWVQATVIVKY